VAPRLARGDAGVTEMLEIRSLAKIYGTGERATHAIADVSFSVAEREFVCVVGPSGCGKTTLLKCAAGLMRPTRGETLLRGRRVESPPEEMALVFQEYSRSLMPWTSVRNNVLLPLRHKKLSRQERKRLVEEAVEAVGLSRSLDRYPWELSGGMQQRVAIARALAYQPSILLMDEPFASVDAQTRADLEDLVLQVRDEFDVTILFVTHDIDESVYLSDRVVVLTHAPTEVKEIVHVDLPSARDQIETKEMPEFAHLRAHVYRLIRRERVDETARGTEPLTAVPGDFDVVPEEDRRLPEAADRTRRG
jgi:NitT/TauT family transport system ATP-binding protein